MKPIEITAAIEAATEKLLMAEEKVQAAERKADTAKTFARRAKLVFKQARKAAKKARKAAKRRKAEAIQAQIALAELKQQITKAAEGSPETKKRGKGRNPERNPSKNLSTAVARKKLLATKPRRRVATPSPVGNSSVTRKARVKPDARTVRRKPLARCETNPLNKEVESVPIQACEEDAPTKSAGLSDLGEQRVASLTTAADGPGRRESNTN